MKKILVTGCAGFIGSNLTDNLLKSGYLVVGIDNFNDYYDPKIKRRNVSKASENSRFKLCTEDILNFDRISDIFKKEQIDIVIHLAARAGVRPSIINPKLYTEVNVLGTVNLLKLSSDYKVKKFIFGSSSSVYGNSKNLPFSEDDSCNQIVSPYAASKKAAEFFVESFAKNTNLKCVILRFFTVYGPKGRPDMAPALFTKAISNEIAIRQYGDGSSSRDYTYIDDIVDGIIKSINVDTGFEIFNLGNNHPVSLRDFIKMIGNEIGKKATIKRLPMQQGDVKITWANIAKSGHILNWSAKTDLGSGIKRYIEWFNKND